jgi:phage related protein
MERHYEFTGETIAVYNKILHRIRATKDLPEHEVEKGELGGWIEKYENLADNAWVSENAKVFDNAVVFGNAMIFGDAIVYGNARVHGKSEICENACIS